MIALAVAAASSCHGDGADVPAPPPVPNPTLSDAEAAGLLYMREEEKLARDVYRRLGAAHGLPIFENIGEAEERHMAAVLSLLERYGLADPVAGLAAGELADPELQRLHDALVARGLVSEEAALSVGALIEETDIVDLRERARETDEPAIESLYANLERGSRNHLRAFVRQLDRRGIDYAPTLLPKSDFDAIVSSPPERGFRGGR